MTKKKPPPELLSPPPSFCSLPYDLALSCLARVSRYHHPYLSMVSKYFRSLIASPELQATRSRMGITETYLCVCLRLYRYNKYSYRWFTLAPVPKPKKLEPITSFPYLYPKYSTLLGTGSDIYKIGSFVNGKEIRYLYELLTFDCLTHKGSRLPKMRVAREDPAVDVINGKVYVIGGNESSNIEDWGEVYDPKTHTWEPVFPTTQDLTSQMSVVPGKLVMDGNVYTINNGYKVSFRTGRLLVKIDDNILYQTRVSIGKLLWYDPEKNLGWTNVKGLDELPEIIYLTYSSENSQGERRRVTVWWKTFKECKTDIWCAEISFERREGELWGFVEWSEIVLTSGRCDTPSSFLLDSVIVTY
ncbi:putative F-box/kelch-repeat protein At5g03000 [Capsella rubella]|uniref:putative F-box/kelch-repeat protein At5g03000 n=1 Tax=Capsella rubella TaxID=81985 RepID=UPI000CD5655B|nr:putative F-box/kelch-repeat protein At5g03000 [Capsella rubella]